MMERKLLIKMLISYLKSKGKEIPDDLKQEAKKLGLEVEE